MKLISMTDFVLERQGKILNSELGWLAICYAQFLKQPLKLEMFIPCDEDGNVLNDSGLIPSYELEQYRKSKEKVLFENVEKYRFTSLSGEGVIQFGTRVNFIFKPLIETRNGIVKVFVNDINGLTDYDLQLTQNAIKQLGL